VALKKKKMEEEEEEEEGAALKEKEVGFFFFFFFSLSSLPRAVSSFHVARTSHAIQRKNQKFLGRAIL
jgi:hypothetical protein